MARGRGSPAEGERTNTESKQYAWALWHGWRGPPELLAQVVRASVFAVQDTTSVRPRSVVRVNVSGDVERFTSPQQFKNEVTSHGLRHFDHITIKVDNESMVVEIILVRRRPKDESHPLKKGVLLEVRSHASNWDAAGVRDKVASSIARAKVGEAPATKGEESGDPPGVVIRNHESEQRRKKIISLITTSVAVIGLLAGQLWAGMAFARVTGDPTVDMSSLVWMGVGGLMGLVPISVIRFLYPPVEVASVTRSQQLLTAGKLLIGPVIGAVVGSFRG